MVSHVGAPLLADIAQVTGLDAGFDAVAAACVCGARRTARGGC